MKAITEKQAIDEFLAGAQIIVGEYRLSKAETINYRDKESGRAMSLQALRHTVETKDASFAVDERLEKEETAAARLAFLQAGGLKKGSRVLLRYSSFVTTKGVTSSRGELELIVNTLPPK